MPKASYDGTASLEPIPSVGEGFVGAEPVATPLAYRATLVLSPMTCSSCVSCIRRAVLQLPWVRSVDINLIKNSGVVIFDTRSNADETIRTIESCGFEVNLENLEEIQTPTSNIDPCPRQRSDIWRAIFAVEGMNCNSCVGSITVAIKSHNWVIKADVNLLLNSATVVFLGKRRLPEIKKSIENVGCDATLENVILEDVTEGKAEDRTVAIRIDGMFCHHCPGDITRELEKRFEGRLTIQPEDQDFSLHSPVLHARYITESPQFTIRHIFNAIMDLNSTFKPSTQRSPTIEERTRQMHAQEQKRTLFRLTLCVFVAVPTSILGIVFMSLVQPINSIRKYLMTPVWAGNVTRLNWALFMLAAPIYFFAADTFHRRAFKEVRAMWQAGCGTSIMHLSNLRYRKAKRATVAIVGDGINDAPALSTTDLGIAVGSRSDIALSSSSFILINSRLTTILTLLDLSRVVFRRVYFNFGWALIYNLIAMPVAAGVFISHHNGHQEHKYRSQR